MVNPGSSSQPPPVTAGSLSWKRCAGCGGKIADRFLLYAMDSYWHSRCLKCSCCQAQLGDIGTSCYTKSGMILCRNDYIRYVRPAQRSSTFLKTEIVRSILSSNCLVVLCMWAGTSGTICLHTGKLRFPEKSTNSEESIH
ncbi:LIM domain transcription factor LMO4 isoform X2 [Monodon monoceros]|uniref:LIM domain transcription factor LMO4 isoform X2 n=1 Tax=Monodon monoceros TaxID=40151 RepID=UPI0010F56793|nr:LIM domain transcription factor LMO4 isoform X2 [Monodon monoceros]